MPVAHALIQAREDLHAAASEITNEQLRMRPGGAASIGLHLRHIAGSIDRLLTYAAGRQLSPEQLDAARAEPHIDDASASAGELLAGVDRAIDRVLEVVRATKEDELLAPREVGRARLPSNVLGLLFHIAEHTQRHTGQTIVTSKVVRAA